MTKNGVFYSFQQQGLKFHEKNLFNSHEPSADIEY